MIYGTALMIEIVILIGFICVDGFFASKASDMAQDKGYDKKKWFHICFWLPPIPYVIVAAMPDLRLREEQEETNQLLKELIELQNADKHEENGDNDNLKLPEL